MNPKITPEACRKLRGDLTQEKAAKLWHTNIRTVQRWESGEIVPSYLTFEGMKAVKSKALEKLKIYKTPRLDYKKILEKAELDAEYQSKLMYPEGKERDKEKERLTIKYFRQMASPLDKYK